MGDKIYEHDLVMQLVAIKLSDFDNFSKPVSLEQIFKGHEFYHYVLNVNSGTLGDFPNARFLRARSFK